jgi:hypothetical protein
MELISGIARNVRSSTTAADALDLDLGGHDVRLEKVAESLVHDGDELIVAGRQDAGAVVSIAIGTSLKGTGAAPRAETTGSRACLPCCSSSGGVGRFRRAE